MDFKKEKENRLSREPYYISADRNLFDNYENEPVMILDDLSQSSIERDQLLLITDRYSRMIGARYRNRYTYNLELVVITSLKDPYQYFQSIGGVDEPVEQLLGRIDLIVNSNDFNVFPNFSYDIYKKVDKIKGGDGDVDREVFDDKYGHYSDIYHQDNVNFVFCSRKSKKIIIEEEPQKNDFFDRLL